MKRTKWIFGLAAIVVTAFVLAAGTRPSDKPASDATVKIDNRSFDPENISVAAGATVTWTNNDDPHVVANDDIEMFKSKALHTDDHFSFTFTKPGTYNYYCAIHPQMTAKNRSAVMHATTAPNTKTPAATTPQTRTASERTQDLLAPRLLARREV